MKEEDVKEVIESMTGEESVVAEVEPTEEATEEVRESDEDAVLAALDSSEEEVGVPAEEVEEPEDIDETEASAEEAVETNELSREMEDALSVLRRDGFTAEDLETMPEGAVLRLAEHRRKVQGDVDRLLRDKAEAAATGEDDAEQTLEDSTETAKAEPTVELPSQADLREAVTPIAEYLGLDEEGTDLLVKFQQSAVKPLQDALDAQSQQFQAIGMQLLMQDVERARQGLEERFPQVSESGSESFGKVLTRMQAMYSDDYDTVDKLMEDAIAVEFSSEFRDAAQKVTAKIRKQQRNGLPETSSSRPESEVPLSADDQEDRILELLESDAPDRYERARALGGRR
jgi:hypothetical protein